MKIKSFLIAAIFLIVTTSSTCKKSPLAENFYSIKIVNNWVDTIKFSVSLTYPDTSLSNAIPRLKLVYPGEYSYNDSRQSYEEVFKGLPADTLSIFFFSVDTLAKYNWQEIRNGYKVLKRADLSLQDLESNNYTISYP